MSYDTDAESSVLAESRARLAFEFVVDALGAVAYVAFYVGPPALLAPLVAGGFEKMFSAEILGALPAFARPAVAPVLGPLFLALAWIGLLYLWLDYL